RPGAGGPPGGVAAGRGRLPRRPRADPDQGETTIGRAEACDLGLFGDPAVERLHARIVLRADGYLLADAAGGGRTLLNDRPVTGPTPLRDGDVIRVGQSVLRFGERQRSGTG